MALAVHVLLAPGVWLGIAPGWVLNSVASEQAFVDLLDQRSSEEVVAKVLQERHRRRSLPASTYQRAVDIMFERYCQAVTSFSHDLPYAAVQFPPLPASELVAPRLLIQVGSEEPVDYTWRARGDFASTRGAWNDSVIVLPAESGSASPQISLVLLANVFALSKTLRAERVLRLDVRQTESQTRELVAPEVERVFRDAITIQVWRLGTSDDDRPQLLLWGDLEPVLSAVGGTFAVEFEILDHDETLLARTVAWWAADGNPNRTETLILEVVDEQRFYAEDVSGWIAKVCGKPDIATRDPALKVYWCGSFDVKVGVGNKLELIR